MLFNSYLFIFLFLPLSVWVFFKIGGLGRHRVAITWLVAASLFFYGWWNPSYLGLILLSVFFNYAVGVAISSRYEGVSKRYRYLILAFGVAANLMVLGYYKYAGFFVLIHNDLVGSSDAVPNIMLPLAISFFTFQQIAYLVDTYRGETREMNFLHYMLFVCFFPQLIAGPIVHHREILPQFSSRLTYVFRHSNLAIGLTIFTIGLFKKTVLADSVAVFSTPVFNAADQGVALSFFEAWGGALAYSFQLYFDFSGYSDMAIGAARLFGIKLPANFNSPYKATSIIDFWRRWHMTLSRFLRDYLYIPLGGGRCGHSRRLLNLMITMLLGGLWHGAGWTFVAWGGLHGAFLVINHAWTGLCEKLGVLSRPGWLWRSFSVVLTFFCVVNAWVLFRATSFDAAVEVYKGMYGVNGILVEKSFFGVFPVLHPVLDTLGIEMAHLQYFNGVHEMLWLLILTIIAIGGINTQQLMWRYKPVCGNNEPLLLGKKYQLLLWKPSIAWGLVISVLFLVSVSQMTNISEFLYFRF